MLNVPPHVKANARWYQHLGSWRHLLREDTHNEDTPKSINYLVEWKMALKEGRYTSLTPACEHICSIVSEYPWVLVPSKAQECLQSSSSPFFSWLTVQSFSIKLPPTPYLGTPSSKSSFKWDHSLSWLRASCGFGYNYTFIHDWWCKIMVRRKPVPKASTRLPDRFSKSTCAIQHSHYVATA